MTPLAQPTPLATGGMPMLIVWAIVIFGMFFLMRRPMKRQQEQQRQMQGTMQPGTRVMLTSGLFGTITHIGDKQAIVELAPGLEVTVLRDAIRKVVQPDEEEFEFADQADEVESREAAAAPLPTEDSEPAVGSDAHTGFPTGSDTHTGFPTGATASEIVDASAGVRPVTHPDATNDQPTH